MDKTTLRRYRKGFAAIILVCLLISSCVTEAVSSEEPYYDIDSTTDGSLSNGSIIENSAIKEDSNVEQLFQSEEFFPEYDMPVGYTRLARLAENNTVLYLLPLKDRYIRFFDRETSTEGILCGKPECTHDLETCNAFAPGAFLSYYNGYIYFTGASQNQDMAFIQKYPNGLYRMSLQGTDRIYIQDLMGDLNGNAFFAIHRGYVYMGNRIEIIESGKYKYKIQFTRQKLGDTENNLEIIFEDDSTEEGSDFLCQLAGNHMYLLIKRYTVSDHINFEHINLYDFDLRNGGERSIWEERFEDGLFVTGLGVYENKPVFVRVDPYYVKDDIIIYSVSEEERSFVQTGEAHLGQTYYSYVGDGVVMGMGNKSDTGRDYVVLDIQGSILYQGEVPFSQTIQENNKYFGTMVLTASSDRFLVYYNADIPRDSGRSETYYQVTELRFNESEQIRNLMEYVVD
ncbi:MAG: hypothetical protein IJM90_08005 [Firmicutes bacterium]|nr:hypothetical protein [Bacillota bacterium]